MANLSEIKLLILNEVEKIESWKGDAYQTDDDVDLALIEIKRLIGLNKVI
jgi:hypothetical protein